MKYFEVISSDKTNDKTDIYLMIKDKRFEYYKTGKKVDLVKPINLFATNIVSQFRELDFPGVGCPEIVSEEIKALIESLGICDNVQFLPTEIDNIKLNKKYYVLNFVETCSNCFDSERSKYTIINKDLTFFQVVYIKKEANINYNIFKIQEENKDLFVNENFVNEYKKRKLTGCDFFIR